MNLELKIKFCHHLEHSKEYELNWNVENHIGALLWFRALRKLLQIKPNPLEARFSGFVGGHIDLYFLRDNLNKCIEIINRDGRYNIPELCVHNPSQELLNRLHYHFEILIGSGREETEYIRSSPPQVKRAVSGLNLYIHSIEELQKSKSIYKEAPEYAPSSVILEFSKRWISPLPNELNSLFSLKTDFGDIVLHYPQSGKTWLDIFLDDDKQAKAGAGLPLNFLTGEFDIFFYKFSFNQEQQKDFEHFLKSKGKDINDPQLKLGYLPVAKLIHQTGKSIKTYKDEITNHQAIKKIGLYINGHLDTEQSFNIVPLDFEKRNFHVYE